MMNIRDFNAELDETALAEFLATAIGCTAERALQESPPDHLELENTLYRWIAVAALEGIIGHAWAFRQNAARVVFGMDVLPGEQATEISGALLERVRQFAQDEEAQHISIFELDTNREARAFLEAAGFERVAEAWELVAPEGLTIPVPEYPTGYFLRAFDELKHVPTVAATINRSFYDRYGYAANEPGTVTEEYLRDRIENTPEDYPETRMFILLNMIGKAVGFVRCRRENLVDAPGIVPEERRNNLALPLLLTAMRTLRNAGARTLRLISWGELPATLDEYKKAGFSLVKRRIGYEHRLAAPPSEAAPTES